MSTTNLNPLPSRRDETPILPIVSSGSTNVNADRVFHHIREIRKDMRITLSYCARKLGISIQEAREQEDPGTDLTISQLLAWQTILAVPLSEIIDCEGDIEDPIRNRSLLLRVMKTAKQIQKTTKEDRILNMSVTLVDQLIELMPELSEVASWPDIGQAHENRDYGQAVYRRFDPAVAQKLEQ